ncbi:apolipoprotein N-acyltransferase [Actinoplanes lobatus]|uniref:Apolipoprotein N-acyltransferase n=2 Tax=Actinoplanes lobatus TaxID=113568 RepID=A0A7W7MLA2_9ACTN|nr:apolipoprotein N-acyltransferase [Actinoplanes lobatus]GGN62481.1 apolipoprotein N-acyltransferase [Actinoplanes lobatus]GIE45117.1 apolipoprotein N-acyltransferase [Actinoplanes lobatus]
MEMTLPPPALADPGAGADRPPRPLRLPVAVALAVAAGAALLLALPPYDLWWLSPVGVALLAAAVHRRRLRAGFGLGVLAGVVLFFPMLEWTRIAAGWLPWTLLAGLQALYVGLAGLAGSWLSPLVDRWRALWPLLAGLIWTTSEFLRDRTPFGGFPWGRLAFSQGDAPTLRLAAYGGAPLVTFAVAAAGGALVALAWRRWSPRTLLPAVGFAAVTGLLLAAPAALPLTVPGGDATTVAIVQGNVPRLGLDFNAQRRAVLDNHVNATRALASEVAAGRQKQPGLVVWPENSSDIDPLQNADAAALIQSAADAIKAPILVGTLQRTEVPGDIYNVGILWRPGTGPDHAQQYEKRHPVPFAEYMPLRSVARLVSDKVDLVRNMLGGDEPGVVDTGAAVLGDVICFEVAYDGIVRDVVTGGAQILAVQTNNATFNEAEARQQLAMVRLRAVEHGREALMVSTVGVSGFVDAKGGVHDSTGFNTAAVVVRDMNLDGPRTLATRSGARPETVIVFGTVVALVGVLPLRRRRGTINSDGVQVSEER